MFMIVDRPVFEGYHFRRRHDAKSDSIRLLPAAVNLKPRVHRYGLRVLDYVIPDFTSFT